MPEETDLDELEKLLIRVSHVRHVPVALRRRLG